MESVFSMRIVTTSHHQVEPLPGLDVCYSEFRSGGRVNKVPVLRIFGITPAGQKTCMHVHGVFPYLYVLHDGPLPSERYLQQFAASLDKALNVALNRASSMVQHVYKISVVSGIPMYGYHAEERPFFKIFLYNPLMIKKVADLLLGGAVMNRAFQPYEAHIPYPLQMFMDYNLYGMNFLHSAAVKFRRTEDEVVPSSPDDMFESPSIADSSEQFDLSKHIWNEGSIPCDLYLDIDVQRETSCELEVDVVAADILNRHQIGDNLGGNPGLAALWEDERLRRQHRGDDAPLSPPESPCRNHVPMTDSEAALHEKFRNIIQELNPCVLPDSPSSQSTLILSDHEEEDEPVICESSILQVVSSSQSFNVQNKSPTHNISQDQSLLDILVSLANEDHDSILSSQKSSQPLSGAAADDDNAHDGDDESEDYDMYGMDLSWNNSVWKHDDDIPQVDGPVDEEEGEVTIVCSEEDEEVPQIQTLSGGFSFSASFSTGHKAHFKSKPAPNTEKEESPPMPKIIVLEHNEQPITPVFSPPPDPTNQGRVQAPRRRPGRPRKEDDLEQMTAFQRRKAEIKRHEELKRKVPSTPSPGPSSGRVQCERRRPGRPSREDERKSRLAWEERQQKLKEATDQRKKVLKKSIAYPVYSPLPDPSNQVKTLPGRRRPGRPRKDDDLEQMRAFQQRMGTMDESTPSSSTHASRQLPKRQAKRSDTDDYVVQVLGSDDENGEESNTANNSSSEQKGVVIIIPRADGLSDDETIVIPQVDGPADEELTDLRKKDEEKEPPVQTLSGGFSFSANFSTGHSATFKSTPKSMKQIEAPTKVKKIIMGPEPAANQPVTPVFSPLPDPSQPKRPLAPRRRPGRPRKEDDIETMRAFQERQRNGGLKVSTPAPAPVPKPKPTPRPRVKTPRTRTTRAKKSVKKEDDSKVTSPVVHEIRVAFVNEDGEVADGGALLDSLEVVHTVDPETSDVVGEVVASGITEKEDEEGDNGQQMDLWTTDLLSQEAKAQKKIAVERKEEEEEEEEEMEEAAEGQEKETESEEEEYEVDSEEEVHPAASSKAYQSPAAKKKAYMVSRRRSSDSSSADDDTTPRKVQFKVGEHSRTYADRTQRDSGSEESDDFLGDCKLFEDETNEPRSKKRGVNQDKRKKKLLRRHLDDNDDKEEGRKVEVPRKIKAQQPESPSHKKTSPERKKERRSGPVVKDEKSPKKRKMDSEENEDAGMQIISNFSISRSSGTPTPKEGDFAFQASSPAVSPEKSIIIRREEPPKPRAVTPKAPPATPSKAGGVRVIEPRSKPKTEAPPAPTPPTPPNQPKVLYPRRRPGRPRKHTAEDDLEQMLSIQGSTKVINLKLLEGLGDEDGEDAEQPVKAEPRKRSPKPARLPRELKPPKEPKEPKPPKERKPPKEPKEPKTPKEPKAPRTPREQKPRVSSNRPPGRRGGRPRKKTTEERLEEMLNQESLTKVICLKVTEDEKKATRRRSKPKTVTSKGKAKVEPTDKPKDEPKDGPQDGPKDDPKDEPKDDPKDGSRCSVSRGSNGTDCPDEESMDTEGPPDITASSDVNRSPSPLPPVLEREDMAASSSRKTFMSGRQLKLLDRAPPTLDNEAEGEEPECQETVPEEKGGGTEEGNEPDKKEFKMKPSKIPRKHLYMKEDVPDRYSPSKRPDQDDDDSSWFTYRMADVTYCNGEKSPPLLKTPSPLRPKMKVRVLRDLFDEFDLSVVGKEQLTLSQLGDQDISELKQQVKMEMEHRRKENIMPLALNLSEEDIERSYAEVKAQMDQEPDECVSSVYDSYSEFDDSDELISDSDGRGKEDQESDKTDEKNNDNIEVAPLEESTKSKEEVASTSSGSIDASADLFGSDKGKAADSDKENNNVAGENGESSEAVQSTQDDMPSSAVIETEPVERIDSLTPDSSKCEDDGCSSQSTDDNVKKANEVTISNNLKTGLSKIKSKPISKDNDDRQKKEASGDEKVEMSELDFSLLKDPSDTGAESSDLIEESHAGLHTPPLTVDSDNALETTGPLATSSPKKCSPENSEANSPKEIAADVETSDVPIESSEKSIDAKEQVFSPIREDASAGKELGKAARSDKKCDTLSARRSSERSSKNNRNSPSDKSSHRDKRRDSQSSKDRDKRHERDRARSSHDRDKRSRDSERSRHDHKSSHEKRSDRNHDKDRRSHRDSKGRSRHEKDKKHDDHNRSSRDKSRHDGKDKNRSRDRESSSRDKERSSRRSRDEKRHSRERKMSHDHSKEDMKKTCVENLEAESSVITSPNSYGVEKKSEVIQAHDEADTSSSFPHNPFLQRTKPDRKARGVRAMQVRMSRLNLETCGVNLFCPVSPDSSPERPPMTDLMSSEDPLWEAQKERLAELPKYTKPSRTTAKKKAVSYHKRLSTAFVSSPRRQKQTSKKLMTNLSALHQATIEGLESNETSDGNYCSAIDQDNSSSGNDAMYKMSFLSPHDDDSKEPRSPPQVTSPTQDTTNGIELNTSVLSPSDSSQTSEGSLYAVKTEVVKLNSVPKQFQSEEPTSVLSLSQDSSSPILESLNSAEQKTSSPLYPSSPLCLVAPAPDPVITDISEQNAPSPLCPSSPLSLAAPAPDSIAVIPLATDTSDIKEDVEKERRERMNLMTSPPGKAHYSARPVRYSSTEEAPPPPPPPPRDEPPPPPPPPPRHEQEPPPPPPPPPPRNPQPQVEQQQQQQYWNSNYYYSRSDCEEYFSGSYPQSQNYPQPTNERPLDYSSRNPYQYSTHGQYNYPTGPAQSPQAYSTHQQPHAQQGGMAPLPSSNGGHTSGHYPYAPPPLAPSQHGNNANIVLTPSHPPPSQHDVQQSLPQHGLNRAQYIEAYYTKPEDMPDKPRVLGGRAVKSCLVRDLPAFESELSSQGLQHWQTLLVSRHLDQLGTSEDISKELLENLHSNHQLMMDITGNRDVIITPCRAPPRYAEVAEWLGGKKQKKKEVKDKGIGKKSKPEEVKATEERPTPATHKPSMQQTPAAVKKSVSFSVPSTSTQSTAALRRASTVQLEIPEGYSSPLAVEDTDDDVYHQRRRLMSSTPSTSKRPMNEEALSPSLTPISAKKSDEAPDDFIEGTPPSSLRAKRLSLRRTSTDSDHTLRRSILKVSTPSSSRDPSMSIIDAPTPKNPYGYKLDSQNIQEVKGNHEFQHLTTLSIELHIQTRGNLCPDPETDRIRAVFYCIHNDVPEKEKQNTVGCIVVDENLQNQATTSNVPQSSKPLFTLSGLADLNVKYVCSELRLLEEVVDLVRRIDADILVGFEIQKTSWGYLIKRGFHLNVNLIKTLSRLQGSDQKVEKQPESDDFEAEQISDIQISGRIVINLWRVLRHELTLNIYTFENVAFHALHKRVPKFSYKCLSDWYDHKTHLHRWRVVDYYMVRCCGSVEIMKQLDTLSTTSEFARVFGIEFYHVLSRGSQYRVESMMLRIAKPLNFIAISPSPQQRAQQKAPECIPLNMEPVSDFYTHPVVVVDFQSLYPSIMIAYNYCFTTCLGRLECLSKANEGAFDFGCCSLEVPPTLMKDLEKDVTICPNQVVFVKQHIRKGILPLMVEEILKTRLMVKKSMKDYKDDQALQKMLHARQLGLKLIANVTFGYTAANYSGRMPLVEVGDSIVRKARETLERAIKLVEDTPEWRAKVVYGDTDSMFILLKGRTKEEAFKIGHEIADAVTADNPKPVKLKFEKVYLPCALQTKKRYVGFMYETPEQKEPVYDAKGIETVRRDGCGAVSKILERSIKLLFSTRDISQVKAYVQKQCIKMMQGRFNIQDCVFAKEYRGSGGYRPGACVPALEIARKRLLKDRCSEPLVSERVPYVIVYGTPGLPLIQLVREPHEVLADPSLRINAIYYITKQVLPPLGRLFCLIDVDVKDWYMDLPRIFRTPSVSAVPSESRKGTISQYFTSTNCPVCDDDTHQGTCVQCASDPQRASFILSSRIRNYEHKLNSLAQICISCMGRADRDLPCSSLDCPVLFKIVTAKREAMQVEALHSLRSSLHI